MRPFARPLSVLLLLAAGVLWADTQLVKMPSEIGVSSRKHKPFTAIAKTTLSRVFPSGAQRTVTTEDRIARDGEGRVLREQHLPWTEDPAQPVYYVNILDPRKWNVSISTLRGTWRLPVPWIRDTHGTTSHTTEPNIDSPQSLE